MTEAEIQQWADTLVASKPEVALKMWEDLQSQGSEIRTEALTATSTCGKSVSEELVKASWALIDQHRPTRVES